MSLQVYDGGVWREPLEVFAYDGGSWRTIREIHIYEAGNWKKIFPSSGSQAFSSTGTTSFTVPAGVYSLNVSVYGAGGGGGSQWFCGDANGGSGGGSGGYRTSQTLSVTPGQSISVTVGAGGTGGYYPGFCNGANPGTGGGTTSVGLSLIHI